MVIYTTLPDTELLRLLKKEDEAAFTEIYNRYWKKLYFLAHKQLKSSEAAEEIVQDVFLALWNNRKEQLIQYLPVYLAAMTRYAVYRSVAKNKRLVPVDSFGEIAVKEDSHAFMENKLLLDIIEKLSAHLPEKCRLVFVHNKLLDQPLKKVAEELGISEKTAEAHLTKALKVIRKNMGDALSVLFIV